MSRRRPVQRVATAEVPRVLLRNGLDLIKLLPAEVTYNVPSEFYRMVYARQLRDVARAKFRELTGAGHSSWRTYPVNVSPAIRKAGEKLAAELARQ